MSDQESEQEKIDNRLQSIELRLSRLESLINEADTINSVKYETLVDPADIELNTVSPETDDDKGLESKIGRFGLAWLGNIVLLVGIAFLAQYMMNIGYRFLSVIVGFIAAGSIFFLANYLKKTNLHMAFMFRMNAHILLFYLILKLHFYTANPVLRDKTISLVLLILMAFLQIYLSFRYKSQAFGALSVVFAIITAIIGDSTHFTLIVIFLAAALTTIYFYRFTWQPLLIVTIILTYTAYFLWLFGNPLMGHTMQLIADQHYGAVYLFGLGACFSFPVIFRKKNKLLDDLFIGVTFVNGFFFTLLLILITLRFYSSDYVKLYAIITICCLAYSTILKSISDWKFASAYYALYGFMAMSISLYGIFGLPRVFLLLSVQSLIVVSMALWFRNRLIVIMNSLLFLSILIIYLISSKHIDSVSFSFTLVAFISARIINWQRSRLQIETDLLRNLYLIEGFVMMLYALYHAVPGQFVTLSWTMAALLYFLLSFVLKNVKYRYLALGTMICAAFYLFIVDLARIEIIYRVLALLFLAAISIGISMYYTNRIKKSDH
jgi:hypothetical protein